MLPGLGHLYVGRTGRALIWFAGLILVGTIAGAERAAGWIAPLVGGVLSLCAAFDAAMLAPRAQDRTS